ncbi:hypothetical protein DFH08DRAFT_824834 [Mycena albidolilacea]|uniref:Uncharacterized protein n=1 Tax=Mycena albidolilacea TaxID=1033008 RepID=A0AAD6Z3W6_9AGAR|nr:hypothetical protein DFH08DRAFT_824834 [Mycena albidolilacea]
MQEGIGHDFVLEDQRRPKNPCHGGRDPCHGGRTTSGLVVALKVLHTSLRLRRAVGLVIAFRVPHGYRVHARVWTRGSPGFGVNPRVFGRQEQLLNVVSLGRNTLQLYYVKTELSDVYALVLHPSSKLEYLRANDFDVHGPRLWKPNFDANSICISGSQLKPLNQL